MFCPYCGMENEEGAVFCAYCGERTDMEDAPQAAVADERNAVCAYCENVLEEGSQFCDKCGKPVDGFARGPEPADCKASDAPDELARRKKSFFRLAVGFALTAAFLLGALGFLSRQYESKSAQLDDALEFCDQLYAELADAKEQNAAAQKKINELSHKADIFDDLRNAVDFANIGAASKHFKVDQGIVVLSSSKQECEITLTTDYRGSVSVSVDEDGYSAVLDFNEDTWRGSTTELTITRKKMGVTTFRFSNNVSTDTFKLIVIVVS